MKRAGAPYPQGKRLRVGGPQPRYTGGAAGAAAAAAMAAANSAAAAQRASNLRTGGFEGLEKKFVDYEVTKGNMADTVASSEVDPTTVNCLNAIAQGDGESQRDGRRCTLTSVHVQGYVRFKSDVLSGGTPDIGRVRLALVLDTQTNGAQFNAEDVFIEPTDGTLATCTFRNLQYQKRFRVLASKVVDLRSQAGAGPDAGFLYWSPDIASFEFHKEFKSGLQVNHSGTTASVASITDNSLHMIAILDGGSNADASLSYVSRVRFIG